MMSADMLFMTWCQGVAFGDLFPGGQVLMQM